MKVSPEARRLAKYKEKKLASRRYNSTLRFVRQYSARSLSDDLITLKLMS